MLTRVINNIRCLFFGHKTLNLISGMGHPTFILSDAVGRELLGVFMCRHCHTLFWKRGQDVPSDLSTGDELELFDAKNLVNKITRSISREAGDSFGKEA